MNVVCLNKSIRTGLLSLFLLGAARPASSADYLLWDREGGKVDASVKTWDTQQVLRRIASCTRWQVYIEPDVRLVVPTRFRNLSEGEALRRLLGDLNFARVPDTNGTPRLYVFRNSRDRATERVPGLDQDDAAKAKPIEDELVVKLKPGESIDELARRLGAKVLGRSEGLNAYRLRFTDADQAAKARESLSKDPSVASVDSNYSIARPDSPEGQAATAPRFSLQPKAPAAGKEIIVGLIDSAVQPQAGALGSFVMDQVSVAGKAEPPEDRPTHGTAMSETILNGLAAGLSKDSSSTSVRILPVDVYGNNATTTTFDVAVGIYKAVNAGARIINLSLGSDGQSSLLTDVIQSSHDQGVIFFAAAGNEPVTSKVYPAAEPGVTAVTAVDRAGNIASYANRGDFVGAGGPGTVVVTFGTQTYIMSGTSASTAYVSGLAAGLAESSGRSLKEIEKAIPALLPVKKP